VCCGTNFNENPYTGSYLELYVILDMTVRSSYMQSRKLKHAASLKQKDYGPELEESRLATEYLSRTSSCFRLYLMTCAMLMIMEIEP
jgi:hypothetical protein